MITNEPTCSNDSQRNKKLTQIQLFRQYFLNILLSFYWKSLKIQVQNIIAKKLFNWTFLTDLILLWAIILN